MKSNDVWFYICKTGVFQYYEICEHMVLVCFIKLTVFNTRAHQLNKGIMPYFHLKCQKTHCKVNMSLFWPDLWPHWQTSLDMYRPMQTYKELSWPSDR